MLQDLSMTKLHGLLIAALALLTTTALAQKYVGGDISCLPIYEKANAVYKTYDGTVVPDLVVYSKQVGMNAMRVRLFVNPTGQTTNSSSPYAWTADSNVCQNLEWVKNLGKRIKNAGMKFMLDLHYSDTWADPGKQWTPEAWASLDDAALADTVYSYTRRVLAELSAAGAEPDFVQTGNEISYGMLWGRPGASLLQCWPSSPTANWDRFAILLNKAVKAVRDGSPKAKVILHVERVSANTSLQGDNANYAALKNFFSKMNDYGISYDIIGLSYYPYFHGALSDLEGAIRVLETDCPEKQVMVVETGYPYAWAVGGSNYDASGTWTYSDEGQKAFADSLVTMLGRHNNVNGLFWWWMEYNAYGAGLEGWYNAPLFDSRTGCATSAFYELAKFAQNSTGIVAMKASPASDSRHYYDVSGRVISGPRGLYIHEGKMRVVPIR